MSETQLNHPLSEAQGAEQQQLTLTRYYQLHAKIYDLTRWSFLFGRTAIIDLAATYAQPQRILEVGCGTGKNLVKLAQTFPTATLTGVDVSPDMLAVAAQTLGNAYPQVRLIEQPYGAPLQTQPTYDLVLFSYALTMFNPGWEAAIDHAYADLVEGGVIVVVDFHHSTWPLFKRWMGVNHVRMDGHLLPILQSRFLPQTATIANAYGGLWQYLCFIGKK